LIEDAFDKVSGLINISLPFGRDMSELILRQSDVIQQLLVHLLILLKSLINFLLFGCSFQGDIGPHDIKLLHYLCLHLVVDLSDLLLVQLLRAEVIEAIHQSVISFAVQTLQCVSFDPVELALHGLYELIYVLLASR
jgi:hypothetical protein